MSETAAAAHPANAAAKRLHSWFMDSALPIWWDRGADLAAGGYFDRLDHTGAPTVAPKRLRVPCRQAHVYALAARLGWKGPATEAARHGLDFVLAQRGADGFYRSPGAGLPTLDGMGLVYDQAFTLLALAAGKAQFDDPACEAAAVALAERLQALAHPLGGYREAEGLAAPMFANPNMHLFESFQAWARLSRDPRWAELAAGEARLAQDRLIDPGTGVLGERFDEDWSSPADRAARFVWPGHLYEWGFLLLDWQAADAASQAAALRLIRAGERHGVDANGFVIFALDERLAPLDGSARLWAQTERIRACARAAALTGDGSLWDAAAQACAVLEAFLQTPTPGLWRDWRDESGAFREEPAPASSLYHIAGAIAELARLA